MVHFSLLQQSKAQAQPTSVTTTPGVLSTVVPTPTPTIAQINYASNAVDIYNDVTPQLNPTTHHIVAIGFDNAWQGWPYTPERHAFVWHDNSFLFEIAAYDNSHEAVADANYNAATQGNRYRTNVIGVCMVLYDEGVDIITVADYLSILSSEPRCRFS